MTESCPVAEHRPSNLLAINVENYNNVEPEIHNTNSTATII